MKKTTSISPEDLLKLYKDKSQKDPAILLNMIIWQTIYEKRSDAWARDLLVDSELLPNPDDVARERIDAGKVKEGREYKEVIKIENNQLQFIGRKRRELEKSVNLPGRGKRGSTDEYNKAIQRWKQINPRPTDEALLAGWSPKPLPDTYLENIPQQVDKTVIASSRNDAPSVKISKESTSIEKFSNSQSTKPINSLELFKESSTANGFDGKDIEHLTADKLESFNRILDAEDKADADLYG